MDDPVENSGGFDNSEVDTEDVNHDEDPSSEDEGEGEDLITGDMFRDYRENDALDDLELSGIDDEYAEDVTFAEQQVYRRAAEAEMDIRERATRRRRLGMEVLNEDSEMTGSGSPRMRYE